MSQPPLSNVNPSHRPLRRWRWALGAAMATVGLAACQTEPPGARPAPAPAAAAADAASAAASAPAPAASAAGLPPPPAPAVDPRVRKERELAEAIGLYAQGRYDDAVVWLTPLIGAPELGTAQQLRVLKFLAFSHCASGRLRQCRQYFDMAFELDPNVQLTDAERGHPVWNKEFNAARAAARNKRGGQRAP